MASPSSRLVYCSAAANRSSNVSDVGDAGLVAFGSGRLVALWNSEVSKLHSLILRSKLTYEMLTLLRDDGRTLTRMEFTRPCLATWAR